MKKTRLFVMTVILMLCLAGCRSYDKPQELQNSESRPVELELFEQEMYQTIGDMLGIDLADCEDEFFDYSVSEIDGCSTIRSVQSIDGIEVYGGELTVALDENGEMYCSSGTYVSGLREFLDTEEVKQALDEAEKKADWMTKAEQDSSVEILEDTIVPVIIAMDDEVEIGRQFILRYDNQAAGELCSYTFVTDLQGERVVDCWPNETAFTEKDLKEVVVTAGQDRAVMSEYGGEIVAYNAKNHFFAALPEENEEPEDWISGCTVNGFRFQEKSIYSAMDEDWETGYPFQVLQSMSVMDDIMDFWREKCGIRGIDGQDGLFKLIVEDRTMSGTAVSHTDTIDGVLRSYVIRVGLAPDGKQTVAACPEVLCHETTHSILRNVVGMVPGLGERGALDEAISDIYAVIYTQNSNWHLAQAFEAYEENKDIKNTVVTMDDYKENFIEPFLSFAKFVDWLGNASEANKSTESIYVHKNAFIISHTVYNIWKNVFHGDFNQLLRVMDTTLSALPSKPDFSDFRDLFVAAVRLRLTEEDAENVAAYFDAAGISGSGQKIVIVEAKQYAPKNQPITIELSWDSDTDLMYRLDGTLDDGTYVSITEEMDILEIDGVTIADVTTTEKDGRTTSRIQLYVYDGCFSLDADTGLDNSISASDGTAKIYIPDQSQAVVNEVKDNLYRSYTGVWLWGICTIDHGTIQDYDSSWIAEYSRDFDSDFLLGTWYNEDYDVDDNWAGSYQTEFRADGTVLQSGYRNRDQGTYTMTDQYTIETVYDTNEYDAPGYGYQPVDYTYTVIYRYDPDDDVLYADYSSQFEAACNSNAGDGTLYRSYARSNDNIAYAGGISYQNGVFCISDCMGLAVFRDIVNGENDKLVEGWSLGEAPNNMSDINGILTDDIDLYEYLMELHDNWKPIGLRGRGYTGTFDGNGYHISNFYGEYDSYDYCRFNQKDEISGGTGLFAMNSGVIKNLAVDGYLYADVNRVGGIVGINCGMITRCLSNVEIVSSEQYVGGIAGTNEGTDRNSSIECCANFGSLTSSSDEPKLGGITGGNWNGARTVSCYNVGRIDVDSYEYVGGIAGKHGADTIDSCWYTEFCCNGGAGLEYLSDFEDAYAAEEGAVYDGTVLNYLGEDEKNDWVAGTPYPELSKGPSYRSWNLLF